MREIQTVGTSSAVARKRWQAEPIIAPAEAIVRSVGLLNEAELMPIAGLGNR